MTLMNLVVFPSDVDDVDDVDDAFLLLLLCWLREERGRERFVFRPFFLSCVTGRSAEETEGGPKKASRSVDEKKRRAIVMTRL